MNAIVVDLETVKDFAVWRPTKEKPAPIPTDKCVKCGKDLPTDGSEPEKCEKAKRGTCRGPTESELEKNQSKIEKDEFPPPYACKIIAFGVMLITDDMPKGFGVWTANPNEPMQERSVLEAFAAQMKNIGQADVVTWNGRHFDLPVIEARSIRHGVQQPWYNAEYRRVGEMPNTDLQVVYCGGRYGHYMHMHEAAQLIGLPGKNGVDGSMVEKLAEVGHFNTITQYCERDVVQTGYLFLRYRLIRGFITTEQYRTACAALHAQWNGKAGFEDFVTDAAWLVP